MQMGSNKLDRCRYGWMLHSGPFIGKCFELYGDYSESEERVTDLGTWWSFLGGGGGTQ